MPRTASFEAHHHRYDDWFVRHAAAYQSELLAVRALLPSKTLDETREIEPLRAGCGQGAFVAVRARSLA